jgi:hypothetical protein
MEAASPIYREEVVAMLFAIAVLNAMVERIFGYSRRSSVARKAYRKRTPEERARWRENQERLESVIERALEDLGTTRAEIRRQLGLPEPRRDSA